MKTIGPLNLYNGFSPLLSNMKDMVVTSVCGFKLFNNSADYIFISDSDIISALGVDVNQDIPWDISQPKPTAEFFVIGSVYSDTPTHHVPFSISCGDIKKSLIAHAPGFIEDGFFKKKVSYASFAENIPIRYPTENVMNELSSGLEGSQTRLSSFSQNVDSILPIINFDPASYICQHPISSKLLNPTKLLSTLPDFFKSDKYPIMIDYFDNNLFYRAHCSQRISTYWRGDETFELNGLHPVYRHHSGKVPGIGFKLFYTYKKNVEIYSSVSNIDTIIFIPDSEVCLIVSRAIVPNAGVEFSNVDVVMPAFEYSTSSRSDEYYHKVFSLRNSHDTSSDFVVHDAQLSPSDYSLSDVNLFLESSVSRYNEEIPSEVIMNDTSDAQSLSTNNSLNPAFNIKNQEFHNAEPLDFSFSADTDTSLSDGTGGYDIASSNLEVDKSSNLLLEDSNAEFTDIENDQSFDADLLGKFDSSDFADIEKLIDFQQDNSLSTDDRVQRLEEAKLIFSDDALQHEHDLNLINSMVLSERIAKLDNFKSIPDFEVDNDLMQKINTSLLELGLSPESMQSSDLNDEDSSNSISSDEFMSMISDLKKQLVEQQEALKQNQDKSVLNEVGVESDFLLDSELTNDSIDSTPQYEPNLMHSGDSLADMSEDVSSESVEVFSSDENLNVVSSPVGTFIDEPAQRVYESVTFPKDHFKGLDFNDYTFRSCRFIGSLSQCKFSDCLFLDCDFSNTENEFVDFSASRFVNCNFSSSSHSNISFSGLNFKNTNFNMASFCDAVLSETDIHDSSLSESSFNSSQFNRLSIYSSNMAHSKFSQSQFSKGMLLDSNLSNSSVTDSSFTDFKFTQSHLVATKFLNSSFNSASFIDSNLKSVSFLRITAPELSMIDCACCEADFSYSDFGNATFINCDFSSSSLKNNNFSNSSLNSSNLSGSAIYKSQFVGSELRLVNLTLATIKGCELLNVDLAGANLDSADFTDSSLPFDLSRFL